MAITINGKTYQGNNIQIKNNKVIIDGKEIKESEKEFNKDINIVIENSQNCNIEIDTCKDLNLKGSFKTLNVGSGDIVVKDSDCGNVNVQASDIELLKRLTKNE